MKFTWSDELDETVRLMALQNQSASQIGAVIGCSRNAVIGRANRRGIQLSKLVISNEPRSIRAREMQQARRAGAALPPPPSQRPVTLAKTATPRVTSIGNPFRGVVKLPARLLDRRDRTRTPYGDSSQAGQDLAPATVSQLPQRDTSHAVDIFGLTSRTCHNPLGPKMERAVMYCGAPTKAGSSYCAHCHAVNYAPRLPPTRATVDKRTSNFGGYLLAAAE